MLFSTKLRAILALAPLSLALPQVGSPDPYVSPTLPLHRLHILSLKKTRLY